MSGEGNEKDVLEVELEEIKSSKITEENGDDGEMDYYEAMAMLETLDVDRDFNIWDSFRKSLSSEPIASDEPSGDGSKNEEEVDNDDNNVDDDVNIDSAKADYRFLSQLPQKEFLGDLNNTVKEEALKASRMVCDERIYSPKYLPVPREKRETRELARFLSVKESSQSSGDTKIIQLLFPERDEIQSVLLKREPVWLHSDKNFNTEPSEKELILLSHGIIIATTSGQQKNTSQIETSNRNVFQSIREKFIRRKFESCILFSEILAIEDPVITESDEVEKKYENDRTFLLEVVNGFSSKELHFECATQTQKDFWIHALSWACFNHTKNDTEDNDDVTLNGKHHKISVSTLYSAAVLGDEEMYTRIKKVSSNIRLDELDKFYGYSALHYAIIWQNIHFARRLIEDGSDINVLCQNESSSPLYHGKLIFFFGFNGCLLDISNILLIISTFTIAKQLGNQKAIDLLNEYSAKNIPPKKTVRETHQGDSESQDRETGNGFSFWREMSMRVSNSLRREELPPPYKPSNNTSANDKAKQLSNKMADNKNALVERGEKLEQLADKTALLEKDASEFKGNAKQLRQALEKRNKNWWL